MGRKKSIKYPLLESGTAAERCAGPKAGIFCYEKKKENNPAKLFGIILKPVFSLVVSVSETTRGSLTHRPSGSEYC